MDTNIETDARTLGAPEPYEDLYVSPKCSVQTAEQRFGQGIRAELRAFVFASPGSYAMMVETDFTDDDEDNDDIDGNDGMFLDEFEPVSAHNMFGDGETHHEHDPHGFPRIAVTRNNLTALSQRYNLYFAAYQDRIYVYQPQRCGPQILPSPSLILHPRPSKLAEKVDGVAIDFHFPHQINHIIVGNLGDLEIVLFSYDDGDVAAYYTHSVARCIRANSMSRATRDGGQFPRAQAQPALFFHENVLKSAWGLAIHSQSRMIAVGSNLHEVTVFAFALTSNKNGVKFPAADNTSELPRGEDLEKERRFPTRTTTWRIVLPLGRYGSNIPNLTFIDDEKGDADKIAAIDVAGSPWILDIWTRTRPVRWKTRFSVGHGIPNDGGWGMLVLPYSAFKPARTVREALGVPVREVVEETDAGDPCNPCKRYLDTTCSLFYVKDFAPDLDKALISHVTRHDYRGRHRASASSPEKELEDISDSENESEDESEASTPPCVRKSSASGAQESTEIPAIQPTTNSNGNGTWSQCVIPYLGETPRLQSISDYVQFARSPDRSENVKHIDHHRVKFPDHLVDNFCMFRTSQTNVELVPFDHMVPTVECKMVLTSDPDLSFEHPWDLGQPFSERISMLIPVPELSLVVAGSPAGRVAFITLTTTRKKWLGFWLRGGFRVDVVVPRKSEDKIRPQCTLIGIAVSPVPYRPGRDLELRPKKERRKPSSPTVYRLIMHYKDHTILQYEFTRALGSGELLVS